MQNYKQFLNNDEQIRILNTTYVLLCKDLESSPFSPPYRRPHVEYICISRNEAHS